MTRRPDSVRETYERELGERAARHLADAEHRHGCCWEPVDGPHHPLCRERPQDEQPQAGAGQESLL